MVIAEAGASPVGETWCPSENTLCELFDGKLSADSARSAQAHLAVCSACRELVAELARSAPSGVSPSIAGPATPRAPGPWLPAGTRVGRYRIIEQVGSGAMGAVYAAHDPDLDRRVALKLLRSEARAEELRARLWREAKAMARLSHPAVITVYDVGTHGSQLFIAMEFLGGGTLRRWLAEKPRSWQEVLAVYCGAGRGLARAHAAGLVHRDFKPDNVLVDVDGRVRVTDFGLARAVGDDTEPGSAAPADDDSRDPLGATLTRAGALVGTPAYMAPEQLLGAPVDARSDIFSFCVSLYEALYGGRPFAGTTVAELRTSTLAGAALPSTRGRSVPSSVWRILRVGLRSRPEDRYRSLAQLLDALDEVQKGRRRVRIAGASALGAAALVFAGTLAVTRGASHRAAAANGGPAADVDAASSVGEPGVSPPPPFPARAEQASPPSAASTPSTPSVPAATIPRRAAPAPAPTSTTTTAAANHAPALSFDAGAQHRMLKLGRNAAPILDVGDRPPQGPAPVAGAPAGSVSSPGRLGTNAAPILR